MLHFAQSNEISRDLTHTGSTFPDLNSMVEALHNGNISSVLLEMYVPVKRKDLFNGSQFEVKDFIGAEITHGVLLEGQGVAKLANEIRNLIVKKNIQTEYLLQENDAVEQPEVRMIHNFCCGEQRLISSYIYLRECETGNRSLRTSKHAHLFYINIGCDVIVWVSEKQILALP